MDQTGTIAELFAQCNIDWEQLEPDDIVDISHLNIETKSFDLATQRFVWKQILNLRRRHDAVEYIVKQDDKIVLRCNGAHKILIHDGVHDIWKSADNIYKRCLSTGFVLGVTGSMEHDVREIQCEKTNNIIPVLDMEVADTSTYIIGDLINHNTTGGNALKFYASQRVDIRRIGVVKTDGNATANKTRVKIIKNKVAPPFKEHEFEIIYGVGIDIYSDLLDVATELGIIGKAGAWYSYNNENIGQGRIQTAQYIKDRPELVAELRDKIFNGKG